MVERDHAELIGRIEQREEEPFDGGARVDEPLAEHAVAHVQQDGDADRHALARELRDGLPLAVLVDLEGVFGESGHQAAVLIEDGGGDADQIDARLEEIMRRGRLILRGHGRAGERRHEQPEAAAHGASRKDTPDVYAAAPPPLLTELKRSSSPMT